MDIGEVNCKIDAFGRVADPGPEWGRKWIRF